MLEELRIRDLGVIEESVVPLGPGFTVVTGETGAGKTMVVTALSLLLGGRADSGAVRAGAARARVEGVVAVAGGAAVEHVQEAGGEVEEDRLLLARQVGTDGRSRAFAGGAAVPAGVLARIGEHLVAVHGQSDQQRLTRAGEQREALDRFAGSEVAALRRSFAERWAELGETEAALRAVTEAARDRAREHDLLRLGLDEIEAVDPQPGEDRALAEEEARLGYADTLRTAAHQARLLLSGDDGGGTPAAADAGATLAEARSHLEGVREHDTRAGELADRLAEVGYLVADLAGDVASYAEGLDSDPARLAQVSARRAALTALTRKYGEDVDEVLAWAARASQRLVGLLGSDEEAARLRGRREALLAELGDLGDRLHEARSRAAVELAGRVTDELAALAMPAARVEVAVDRTRQDPQAGGLPWRAGAHGYDDVELRLAANPGSELRPLARAASGGELSRVMLALEVVTARTSPVPTFVFDEVDAGVGGRAAVEVGRRLRRLAETAQVVVVTHLPQVAAFADHHVVVTKTADDRVTSSDVVPLDDAGREQELSRMLAGREDSRAAREHARELLLEGRGAGVS